MRGGEGGVARETEARRETPRSARVQKRRLCADPSGFNGIACFVTMAGMGKRGPKAKPTLLSLAGHNAGGDPTAPPIEVAGDADALAVWHSTVANLRLIGVWSRADAGVVARYCCTVSLWRAALAEVRASGTTQTTKTGFSGPTPAALLLGKLSPQLLAMEVAMGLTPRARSKMQAKPQQEPDALTEFLIGP